MKSIFFLTSLFVFISCKKEAVLLTKKDSKDTQVRETQTNQKDTIAYFDKSLTYRFSINGTTKELWFYVNEETPTNFVCPE